MSASHRAERPVPGGNYLIYDGDCPFCSRYARLVRLQEAMGPLRLIDARQPSVEVAAARAAGYVLDEGMLLHLAGRDYFGGDCLNRLALLSSRSTLFNRITYALLRSPRAARWSYPILRFGRNTALFLLGRTGLGF
jgi:predicted DCC family thiol-disulfide oxidoreductase YuxK